ncbi:hypothetical protein B5X24_HaOG209433 [Helicoverpa armigera]|uniref:Uncharacterized protein n=1 Tax=Helicoverpa armigera TaxID=29058 RepID=A0A2W1BIM5_HELAM|nr:hypothetical protein B5X24_HaOG209433 [Helicoverpa armigera]
MKGFVLFLVVVLLAYTCAAPQATNHAPITASGGSAASGVVSGSHFGDGAFSAGGNKKSCGLLQTIVSALWNVC